MKSFEEYLLAYYRDKATEAIKSLILETCHCPKNGSAISPSGGSPGPPHVEILLWDSLLSHALSGGIFVLTQIWSLFALIIEKGILNCCCAGVSKALATIVFVSDYLGCVKTTFFFYALATICWIFCALTYRFVENRIKDKHTRDEYIAKAEVLETIGFSILCLYIIRLFLSGFIHFARLVHAAAVLDSQDRALKISFDVAIPLILVVEGTSCRVYYWQLTAEDQKVVLPQYGYFEPFDPSDSVERSDEASGDDQYHPVNVACEEVGLDDY